MCSFQGVKALNGIPVAIAKGIHLFPFRTQKLSLSAPMVLGWRRPGRVGRCRIQTEETQRKLGLFSYPSFLPVMEWHGNGQERSHRELLQARAIK